MKHWGLFLCLSLLPALSSATDLANLGSQSSISLAEEERIGIRWWRQNYKLLHPDDDFLLQLYVEDLIARLKQGEELAAYQLNVRILSSAEFNAFAAPGGIVGVNLGLWRLSETESELASVLAHELAHLSQRHFIRMLEDARRRNNVSLASTLAGLGLLLTGNTPAGVLAIYGAANFQIENYLETSRRFEREADSQAVLFMRRGRFSLVDAANVYRRLLQASGGESGAEYMRTHPFVADRINDAQLRAIREEETFQSRSADYAYIRARALSALDLPIRQDGSYSGNSLAEYAQAIELKKNGKEQDSVVLLKRVSDAYPLSSFLFLSYIEGLIEAKRTDTALDLLNKKKRYTDTRTAWYYYSALAYAQKNDYRRAVVEMETVVGRRPRDEFVWQLLQSYYEKLGNKYDTFRTRMAYQLLTGEERSADINYRLAREEAAGNEILLARLQNLHSNLAAN